MSVDNASRALAQCSRETLLRRVRDLQDENGSLFRELQHLSQRHRRHMEDGSHLPRRGHSSRAREMESMEVHASSQASHDSATQPASDEADRPCHSPHVHRLHIHPSVSTCEDVPPGGVGNADQSSRNNRHRSGSGGQRSATTGKLYDSSWNDSSSDTGATDHRSHVENRVYAAATTSATTTAASVSPHRISTSTGQSLSHAALLHPSSRLTHGSHSPAQPHRSWRSRQRRDDDNNIAANEVNDAHGYVHGGTNAVADSRVLRETRPGGTPHVPPPTHAPYVIASTVLVLDRGRVRCMPMAHVLARRHRPRRRGRQGANADTPVVSTRDWAGQDETSTGPALSHDARQCVLPGAAEPVPRSDDVLCRDDDNTIAATARNENPNNNNNNNNNSLNDINKHDEMVMHPQRSACKRPRSGDTETGALCVRTAAPSASPSVATELTAALLSSLSTSTWRTARAAVSLESDAMLSEQTLRLCDEQERHAEAHGGGTGLAAYSTVCTNATSKVNTMGHHGSHVGPQTASAQSALVRQRAPVSWATSPVASAMFRYLVGTFALAHRYRHPANDIEGFGRTLLTLCTELEQLLQTQPAHPTVHSPCYVFGDLHGNFADLFYFMRHLLPFHEPHFSAHNFLFLGDYVDRGACSVEVVAYLFALKVLAPSKVMLLRGNHEDTLVSGDIGAYGGSSFRAQCHALLGASCGEMVWQRVSDVFARLPLSANIDGRIFCVHGGLPRYAGGEDTRLMDLHSAPPVPLRSLFAPLPPIPKPPIILNNNTRNSDSNSSSSNDVGDWDGKDATDAVDGGGRDGYKDVRGRRDGLAASHAKRGASTVDAEAALRRYRDVALDACWADPAEKESLVLDGWGFGANPRGSGVILFGNRAVDDFLRHHDFELIFRAHQEKTDGLRLCKRARVLTIFSTSAYVGHRNGAGAVLVEQNTIRLIVKNADVDISSSDERE